MAISYRKRLIVFNKLKHEKLLEKSKKAKKYFVQEDFDAINEIPETICQAIWKILEININQGNYGLSKKTCTFCIYDDIFEQKCKKCEWGNNHKVCKDPKGKFQIFQQILKDKNINTISSDEYKEIIKICKKIK